MCVCSACGRCLDYKCTHPDRRTQWSLVIEQGDQTNCQLRVLTGRRLWASSRTICARPEKKGEGRGNTDSEGSNRDGVILRARQGQLISLAPVDCRPPFKYEWGCRHSVCSWPKGEISNCSIQSTGFFFFFSFHLFWTDVIGTTGSFSLEPWSTSATKLNREEGENPTTQLTKNNGWWWWSRTAQ